MKLRKIKKAMAAETLGKYIIFAMLLALIVWGAYLLFKDTLFPWLNSLGLKIGIGGGQSGLNYVRTGVSISSVEANIVKGNNPCPIQIGELRDVIPKEETGFACPAGPGSDPNAKLVYIGGQPTYFWYPIYIDQEKSGGHWVYICSKAGGEFVTLGVLNIEGKTILKAFNYAYFPYFFKPRGWRMYTPWLRTEPGYYGSNDVEILKKLNGAYIHPADLVKLKEKGATVRLCIEQTTTDINKIWDDVYALVIKKNDQLWILRGFGAPKGITVQESNIMIYGSELYLYSNNLQDNLKIGVIDSDKKLVIDANYLSSNKDFNRILNPADCKKYGLNTGKLKTTGYCDANEIIRVLDELNGKSIVTKGVGDTAAGIKYISEDDFEITNQLIVFKHV